MVRVRSRTLGRFLSAALISVLALSPLKSIAQELIYYPPVVQLSVMQTVLRGGTEGAELAFIQPAYWEGTSWEGSLTFLLPRPRLDFTNHTTEAFLSGYFVDSFRSFNFGLGVSYTPEYRPFLGSNFNFALLASYQFNRYPITIGYKHWSDADITSNNRGRDLVFVGYRF